MSAFDMQFPEDLLGELLDTDAEEICKEALREAAPVLVDSMQRSARAAILHEGESEMISSIKANTPKKTKDGSAYIVNVGPTGTSSHVYYDKGKKKRKHKVSNALKAIWKEYGIAGRQAPSPFITNATLNAEAKVMEKLQDAYTKRTGGV